ncbi:MAG: homoserine dehydrogenase [Verrucomicrobiota bacterium]|nr:homoserine dehydrogenase [Verrucomicrobiota bacterium]
MRKVNIGLVGCGTVGSGVVQGLARNGSLMSSRLGVRLSLVGVGVRNARKARPARLAKRLVTTDWESIVRNPKIDVVMELMGGTTTARKVVAEALKLGKPVITANKALISTHGESLFKLVEKNGGNLYYEAAVAGGIPIIKSLREGLSGNRIQRLYGILNGTCNYILTQMELEGMEFVAALEDAQRMGYAEAEPSLDVDGFDAQHKAGILASLAHGFWVNPSQIFVEGIRHITTLDIEFARSMGYCIKLLGIVKKLGDKVQIAVHPALLPEKHVLANVSGVYNAILVRGDIVGDTLHYGQGAGADATASAVLSDLADAALDLKNGSMGRVPPFVPHEQDGAVLPMDKAVSPFYLRLSVIDRPGTLAKIAAILGGARIGICSVIQPEGHVGESVPLIMMLHDAPEAAMRQALKKIARLSAVKAKPTMIRVETFD